MLVYLLLATRTRRSFTTPAISMLSRLPENIPSHIHPCLLYTTDAADD